MEGHNFCREKYYPLKVQELNNQDLKKWSNPKKDILAKVLPEDSQALQEKTNLSN